MRDTSASVCESWPCEPGSSALFRAASFFLCSPHPSSQQQPLLRSSDSRTKGTPPCLPARSSAPPRRSFVQHPLHVHSLHTDVEVVLVNRSICDQGCGWSALNPVGQHRPCTSC